jgi:hypothetical protein
MMSMARARSAIRPMRTSRELSAAQRAAVVSDARLVVVQGGPGAGKTEAAVGRVVRLLTRGRQDPVWVLVVTSGEAKVQMFRRRLARALVAAGCPEATASRAEACVIPASILEAGHGDDDGSAPVWTPREADRIAAAAADLAIGVHPEEARAMVEDVIRLVARGAARDGAGVGALVPSEGEWMRRGVALVEDAVRAAQVEALRRLRVADGLPRWVADLGGRLRRPTDVTARARELRSALDRARRSEPGRWAELERIRSWVDVAAIDLAEAARREAAAAVWRRRLWETAVELWGDLGPDLASGHVRPGQPQSGDGVSLGQLRHVIVDDAHDLPDRVLGQLQDAGSHASFFVTGDQRAAGLGGVQQTKFRTLLRDAGRAVLLLEAPRFGAGVGRFANALGAQLWPPSEPGGYAPAVSRLDFDPSANAAVELWLVGRRSDRMTAGLAQLEPIGAARRREARVVAAGVRRALAGAAASEVAILAHSKETRALLAAALEREGVDDERVCLCTVDEARGREWSTVFVTGLDESFGGPGLHRSWLDAETGLPVLWPVGDDGRRIWPFSSLLLAQRAATARDALARQRLFLAVTRARTHLVLSGVTRDRPAGGVTCIAPVEWLRRQLEVVDLAHPPAHGRMAEAEVRVAVVDGEALPPA